MATTLPLAATESKAKYFVQRWFFTGMALVMLFTVVVAFVPSIAHPAARRAPLSLVAGVHGMVFFTWLLIFLTQSLLVAGGHVAWHKRLGLASVGLLVLMVPLAWEVTLAMVRRGFDLSGDLGLASGGDVALEAVFPLFNTLIFAVLAIAALLYRGRPEIHKRLMLFANIELMPAPLAHLIGHSPVLAPLARGHCHGANLDICAGCGGQGLGSSEAHPPAHRMSGDSADGIRRRGSGANRNERGLAPLCRLAGWINQANVSAAKNPG